MPRETYGSIGRPMEDYGCPMKPRDALSSVAKQFGIQAVAQTEYSRVHREEKDKGNIAFPGSSHNIHHRWVAFTGNLPHMVKPFSGDR